MQTTLAITPLLALAACTTPARVDVDPPPLPNIVFVLADDMGYGDVHALNPNSGIPTPNLDRLASGGTAFTDAHTPSAVCTPTRYGLLTGRYCWRGAMKRGVINGYGAPVIEPGRSTVANLLDAAGYYTAIVGKWHLGLSWPREGEEIDFSQPVGDTPLTRGFDESFIIPASLDFPPYVYIEGDRVTSASTTIQEKQRFPAFPRQGPRGDDLVMEEVLDRLTDEAVRVVRERAAEEEPYFLYFPLTAPHKPVLPHPRFRGTTGLGDYGDFIAQVDDAVGRVLAAVDASGEAENTLVVYTSDNGSFMFRLAAEDGRDHVVDATVQAYLPENHRANGPLRGTKADIWEAGHRVPFLVRWPRAVPAGERCAETICLTDFFATCAEIAGVELTGDQAEDSFSFLALATGGERSVRRPPVIHHSGSGMFAIRDGSWKLVAGNGSGGREKPRGKPFEKPYALFDLDADLGEAIDALDANPEKAAELESVLDQLRSAPGSRAWASAAAGG